MARLLYVLRRTSPGHSWRYMEAQLSHVYLHENKRRLRLVNFAVMSNAILTARVAGAPWIGCAKRTGLIRLSRVFDQHVHKRAFELSNKLVSGEAKLE